MTNNSKQSYRDIFTKYLKEKYARAFPMLEDKRMQAFITVALTLVTVSILGVFAINPTITTIINLQRQLKDNHSVDQKFQEKITNISLLQQQYETLQTQFPLSFVTIPPTSQIPQHNGQIQTLEQQTGINIDRVQTQSLPFIQEEAKQHPSYSFSLTASGTQQNITHFTSSLFHFDRIINIHMLSLTKNANDKLLLDIKGTAFFKTL